MTATIPSTALATIQPTFTDAERLAIAGFLAGCRGLNPGRRAPLVLACLRKGETFGEFPAGFGVGTATAWRYVNETVALLAARAPEAAPGCPGREEGPARLRRRGRDPDPDRPGRRRPPLLLRQSARSTE